MEVVAAVITLGGSIVIGLGLTAAALHLTLNVLHAQRS